MRRRRWIAGIAALILLVTSIGVALAEEREPWEVEAEGLDKVAEVLPTNTAGRTAGHELGLAVKGGPGADNGSATTTESGSKRLSFFPDHELPCSTDLDGAATGCGQALEPEVKSGGPNGTIFATAQDGTPAGVMAWNCGQTTFDCQQLGKPDSLTGPDGETGITGGGGDNELAIGTPSADGSYRIYVSSLMSLATNAVAVSTDEGATWKNNVVASSFAGVDRQWLAAYGEKTAYLAFHEIYADSILMTRTDDGGDTWGPPIEMISPENLPEAAYVQGSENIPDDARSNAPDGAQNVSSDNLESNLVALPDGGVALAFVTGAQHLFLSVTDKDGANPVNVKIADVPGPRGGTLFPSIAVDRAGNLYVVTSNLDGVFLTTSRDRGQTWSPLLQVSGDETNSAVFPYVVAGDAGRVGVTWLASTTDDPNDAEATWTTQYAFSDDLLGKKPPKFLVTQASDHIVHEGPVCLEGLNCDVKDGFGANGNSRALAEVVQAGITKDGRVMIAYPDTSDGAHAGAWSWLVEQNSGPGLYDSKTTPPPPPAPAADAGGKVTGVSPSGSQKLYFVNSGAGNGEAPPPIGQSGYAFDGTTIAGDLSTDPGTVGHVGVCGYAANFTPGAGGPMVFTAPDVTSNTTIAGNLTFDLFVQNELADNAATELDFNLIDVAADGTERPITGLGAQNGNAVVGGADPTHVTITVPLYDDPTAGWVLLAGHHLRLEMGFPFVVSSTTRFYYGDSVYPGAITLGLG